MRVVVDPLRPDPAQLEAAARLLREGKLIAYPTDTLYGLGADARNPRAVQAAAEAKGRSKGSPFPLLVSDVAAARALAGRWPAAAQRLAELFWPGALTLVLPVNAEARGALAGDLVSRAGAVGLRVPAHAVALGLIERLGGPLVGTSANLSGSAPGRDPQTIEAELGRSLEMLLDVGPLPPNQGSTVIDLSEEHPRIIRRGAIDPLDVLAALREIE